jgi:hypothetical protein
MIAEVLRAFEVRADNERACLVTPVRPMQLDFSGIACCISQTKVVRGLWMLWLLSTDMCGEDVDPECEAALA